MALSEFELIERYFRHCGAPRRDVRVGVGDDAAVLDCAPGRHLVAAVDKLVEGVHFPAGSPPASIGHRALAVNLSDLAAMGAEPAWALLALTLPRAEESWLAEFARGLGELAHAHGVALVGGNTTRGPLSVTVQLLGFTESSPALLRSGAGAGDLLYVSGTTGDAAAGLLLEQSSLQLTDEGCARELRQRFLFPTPRVALGRRLGPYASACIDISDGLLGDAGKLAQASGCAITLEYSRLPVSAELLAAVGAERAGELALTGGDDYELCFAVPAARTAALLAALPPAHWQYRQVGVVCAGQGASVLRDGSVMDFSHRGFDHFTAPR